MSIKFTWSIRVNGTLTDADSTPELADSTATYGVKRLDTNATVVASGTALTHESTGVYSYTLTGETSGVTYRAVLHATVSGSECYVPKDKTAAGAETGYYATQSDLSARFTDANLAVLSNMDGSSASLNTTTIGLALAYADRTINELVRSNGYVTPVATNEEDFASLTEVACAFAISWLYRQRRWRDDESMPAKGAEHYETDARNYLSRLLLRGMKAARISTDDRWPMVVV